MRGRPFPAPCQQVGACPSRCEHQRGVEPRSCGCRYQQGKESPHPGVALPRKAVREKRILHRKQPPPGGDDRQPDRHE